MSGCSWQEKSFTVAVNGKTCSNCEQCKKELETPYKINGKKLCKGCFNKAPSIGIQVTGAFNTHKDQAYYFNAEIFGPTPVEIRSKRHYEKMLKEHGYANASPKECMDEARFRKRINKEDDGRNRKKIAEKIFLANKERLIWNPGKR